MTTPKKIEEIYAWIVTDTDGSEGVPAQLMGQGAMATWAPAIGADRARIDSFRNSPAMDGIKALKRPHKLVVFTRMMVLEEYL